MMIDEHMLCREGERITLQTARVLMSLVLCMPPFPRWRPEQPRNVTEC